MPNQPPAQQEIVPPPPVFPVMRQRTAAPQFFARLAGLAALVLTAWNGVDAMLHAWVVYQETLVESLQNAGLHIDHRLPPLTAVGEPDAPLQIVASCDAAQLNCRQLLGHLLTARERTSMPARLVWLQHPADDEASEQLAVGLQAAQAQQVLWPVLRRLATVPGKPTLQQLRTAVEDVHGYPHRLTRDLEDSEIVLHVATDKTMAEALAIPDDVSVLVSGLPLRPEDVKDLKSLEAALQRETATLERAIDATDGHVEAAWLRLVAQRPARVRDRYIAWILRGDRARALPEARAKRGKRAPRPQ